MCIVQVYPTTNPISTPTAMGGKTVEAVHSHEVVYMYSGKLRLRCPGDRPTVGLMEHKRRLLDVRAFPI